MRQGDIMTVKRMDNVGIVVEDIDAAIEFFTELGLDLEGRAPSMIRSPVSANAARSSSAKWSSTKTRIGSATSGAPKEFSSGLPKSSGRRLPDEHPPLN